MTVEAVALRKAEKKKSLLFLNLFGSALGLLSLLLGVIAQLHASTCLMSQQALNVIELTERRVKLFLTHICCCSTKVFLCLIYLFFLCLLAVMHSLVELK